MERKPKKLGEILIEYGLITQEQLMLALTEQQRTKEILGAILIKRKFITEMQLLRALSDQFNIPIISLKYKYIDWNLVKEFTPAVVLAGKLFPLERDSWTITIAITNPLDASVLEQSEKEAKGLRLKLVLVPEAEIKEAVERYRQYLKDRFL